MQQIIQSSHCQEEPTMSAHCARIPAHARPLAPPKVMMCSVWSDWPWPQWPWRAGDVARAAPPSPWSGPAVCGSPRCHHSPPRSGPLPPPVNKPHGQHLDLLVVVYTAFKGNAQCTKIKWKIHSHHEAYRTQTERALTFQLTFNTFLPGQLCQCYLCPSNFQVLLTWSG